MSFSAQCVNQSLEEKKAPYSSSGLCQRHNGGVNAGCIANQKD